MCLRKLKKPIPKVKYAYKVFKIFYKYKTIESVHNSYIFKLNEWEIDYNSNRRISTQNHIESYQLGFHCFTNKKDAISYKKYMSYLWDKIFILKIYKVEVKDIVAYGLQEFDIRDANTIVCKQIKLLEEI